MEEIDWAEIDWAEMGWITHRTPILMDADEQRDVRVPRKICKPAGDCAFVHYRTIVPGQPWHSSCAQVDQPAAVKPDQFTALEQRVVVVENTMRQLMHGSKFRLVVEPR